MRDVLWHRAVGTRLTFLLAGAGVLSVVMLALAVRDHARLASELAWINEAGKVRRASFALLYEATMVRGTEGAERVRAQRALRQHATELERGLAVLRAGNPGDRHGPSADPGVMTHVASLERRWTVLEPMLEEVADDGEVATSALDALLREYAAEANAAVEQALRADAARARRSSLTAVVLGLLTLVLLIVAIVLGRRMARRTRELAVVSTRIAGGELLARAPSDGGDELAALGRSFNAMTSALRDRIDAEKHARRRLDQVLAEIERVSEEGGREQPPHRGGQRAPVDAEPGSRPPPWPRPRPAPIA
ncbi:MAG: HAMP domain-containing protein [Sandaracinaceae bacterium]|nr:HAMP domain-containing protein [Sandaracinaceae bacterium]